ncbi:hypothetical protein L1D31_22460, partial [Vibrio sp. Isolate23]|uniref:hypothetical protein n=1 Tax=Vibrio sp. Isolate23 TaxID=2908533 RepID=UPI001EFE516A
AIDTVVSAGAEFGINVAMGNSVEKSLQMAAVGAAIGVASTSAGIGVGKIKSTDSRIRPQGGARTNYGHVSPPEPMHYFTDTYKSQPRLNIVAHGTAQPHHAVSINGVKYTPDEFYENVVHPLTERKYYANMRLLICCSAESGLGQTIANSSEIPVKAFSGSVFTSFDHDLSKGKVVKNSFEAFSILPAFWEEITYKPRKFYPSVQLPDLGSDLSFL